MNCKSKNGYYLSTYFSIDRNCNIFDVSLADRHDQNMALWKYQDGIVELIAYWELERYTGIKHFNRAWYSVVQLRGIINELLKPYHLDLKNIIHIFGTPELDPTISYDNQYNFTYHNLCHLFSAIMLDTDLFYNQKILGMALDYGSDYETELPDNLYEFVGCIVDHGNIKLFPIQSPAALWSVAADANQMGEGSLMALASATSCSIPPSVNLHRKDFGHIYSKKIWAIYSELIGQIKFMDQESFMKYATGYDHGFSLKENKISAIMKLIQKFSTEMIDEQVSEVLQRFGLKGDEMILAVGGGFCLNCPTNTHLMKKYRFRGFMAAPCINDGGQSLGIGLLSFYQRTGYFSFSFENNPFRAAKIYDMKWIVDWKMDSRVKQISRFNADIAAKDICNDVVVWYEDSAEIGPRALGHRSILGNPANPETKDRLNHIKQREFWRPVAPIVTEEEAPIYFEDIVSSPYMLQVFRIKTKYRKFLSSVVHLDGTARVQTIRKNNHQLQMIYQLLLCMKNNTGYPMLCNTSLNDRNEPIIESPQRVIEFALEKRIPIVYINGYRVELQLDCQWIPSFRHILSYQPDNVSDLESAANPYGVSREDIHLVFRKYRKEFDLNNPDDTKRIIEVAYRIREEQRKKSENMV